MFLGDLAPGEGFDFGEVGHRVEADEVVHDEVGEENRADVFNAAHALAAQCVPVLQDGLHLADLDEQPLRVAAAGVAGKAA